MSRSLWLSLVVLLSVWLAGCPDEPERWQLVASQWPEALLAVSGRSSQDVYAVGADKGRGPAVLHFDGERWTELATGHRGDLWWVHAFPQGPVMMAGGSATILRYEGGQFTRMPTPGLARHTVYGLWGARPDDVYAVGSVSGRGGFVWHYDGTAWRELDVPHTAMPHTSDGDIPGFFKVWGNDTGDV